MKKNGRNLGSQYCKMVEPFEQANKPTHKTNEAQKIAQSIAVFVPRSVVKHPFRATRALFLALQAERSTTYWDV